ncbi:MAG: PilC/PilY family type IV pilus protein [Gammaproteobacteria bacterium]|nr:PilC/PilY family type IV pilus protein [Gammaproteobacteria bacterium]
MNCIQPDGYRITVSSRVKRSVTGALLTGILFTAASSPASTDISNSPLFISNSVQPNIFFMLDDSGSMRGETLYNEGVPVGTATTNTLSFSPAGTLDRQRLCHGFNVLAYNPNVRYTPWRGKDANNVSYSDADILSGGFTTLRNNPYCPAGVSASTTIDASGAVTNCNDAGYNGTLNATAINYAYFPWTDTDADGQWDSGECGLTDSEGVTWAELASTGTTTVPATEQQRNFANWYTYYRKRDFVMKRAVTELTYTGRHRMGFSTLWNNNGVAVQVNNIDNISVPVDPVAQADKEKMLRHLSNIGPASTTPLRTALRNTGKYFEGINDTDVKNVLFSSAPSHPNSFKATGLSPILDANHGGECQQNFTILLTDGEYNGPAIGMANTDGDSNTSFDGTPFADGFSDTLADVAMNYYERDLAPSLADDVPVLENVDEAAHQHMVTFTVSFGLTGALDPFNTKTPADNSDSDPRATGFAWPDPADGINDVQNRIDDLWHAAYNGRGQFMSASDGQKLIKAFEDALSNINQRAGSASAIAVSTGAVSTDTRLYQSTFDSGTWEGHLFALQFDSFDIINSGDWGGPPSDAAEVLKTQNWNTGRHIVTWNPAALAPDGTAFRWNTIGASQQAALIDGATDGTGNPDAVLGQQRLEFIRGDHGNESKSGSGKFRSRGPGGQEFKLGDIVHSSPLYVGAPPYGYLDALESVSYNSFRVANFERKAMIYVGANDGMLHAFDAETGEEKLAYVPSSIYHKLPELTDPAYSHQYYVDETPVAGDAFYNGAWHTVLLGSLRGGGKSVFALDITDPLPYTDSLGTRHSYKANFAENNAANIVMWEFTDPDLGFTFGKPAIGRLANGKWVAIFGNGYNSSIPLPGDTSVCGTSYSCSGKAHLFIVDIETGALLKKINTGAGSATAPNGLNAPSLVDDNNDSIVDLVYAGDLQGNLWKFDVSSATSSGWVVSKNVGGKPAPLFTATDDNGIPQPITSAPEIADQTSAAGGLMVFFGTGRYLGKSDIIVSPTTQMQSFYGIWDETGSGTENNTQVKKANLLEQAITQTDVNGNNAGAGSANPPAFRTSSDTSIDSWGSSGTPGTYMGWKIDFDPAVTGFAGERVIYKSLAWGDTIIFSTLIPEDRPCGAGAKGWIMALNRTNGGPPPEAFFDTNEDGEIDLIDNSVCNGTACGGQFDPGGAPVEQKPMQGIPPAAGGVTPPRRSCDNLDSILVGGNSSGDTPTSKKTKTPVSLCRQSWRELQ